MSDPAVLLVTSAGAPAGSVVPVLAALEAAGVRVRAIDVGRAGARSDNPLDKVVQAVAGELAERRLMRELAENPPDVTMAFDPATATALGLIRDQSIHAAPVLAVVAELDPEDAWAATDADRYLVIDDEAAVALVDHGVDGARILPVGPLCERAFVEAARTDRSVLRRQYRIDESAPVVVVEVGGLGYETTSQVAMQLSLAASKATFVFDAGGDADAAMALRRQVPTLDMRAKLFGRTEDAPRFWRCADVVVARPVPRAVARTLALGTRMVSFLPEGRVETTLARALETRGLGATASTTLLLSSALEPLMAQRSQDSTNGSTNGRAGTDGAANVADIAWVVARDRREVLDERRAAARASTRSRVDAAASAAEAAARSSSAASGLEDLSGDAGAAEAEGPDAGEIARLRTEVRARLDQLGKTVAEARQTAERWDARQAQARDQGDQDGAREAERKADAERGRMHAALGEMAQMQSELDRLEKAAAAAPPPRRTPPRASHAPKGAAGSAPGGATRSASHGASRPTVDDLLDQMKSQHGGSAARGPSRSASGRSQAARDPSTIDDELAALKRKMSRKKP